MSTEIKNTFSWSKTRDEVFRECLRKYFFQYYGYWNGWKENADPRVRQIYVLKNLQTRHVWAGDRVHRRIKALLDHIRRPAPPPPLDQVLKGLLDGMRIDFRASRDGEYRLSPKRVCALFEHEYQIPLPDSVWKDNADHAVSCLRNFYESAVFRKIAGLNPGDWLETEELNSFDLDGVKVFVQLDFACREGDRILIYDWKTGRSSKASSCDTQLACYVLYAAQRWSVAPESVCAIEFNLATGVETRYEVDREKLEFTREYIRDSADEMLFPLTDPENNTADEHAFDFAESEAACRRCNFLKVCPRFD